MFSAWFLKLAASAIRLYQRTISPDHGLLRLAFPSGVCRFSPTCSEYTVQALQQHRWLGVILGLKRVARCHPWSDGGYDPVPAPKRQNSTPSQAPVAPRNTSVKAGAS
ncbi:membrane protein insertion efficiency factor YidD [Patescibacteria group bacterium]|nr:membrane protein insertion efficiency factor YidD [Patescibacteria group bacterium]